jgi:hypothetical protein
VKCDESRPACRRCVSAGRVCDGYGIWGGGSSDTRTRPNNALSIDWPVPLSSLNPDEQLSFDWFKQKTTKKFAGMFTSDFWETLVFQASVQEPAVRHAIVALSAAHRFDSNHGPWRIPATNGFDAEKFTLQQYNKAIYSLRCNTIMNNTNSIRVTLITCLIFVTLEYLRGQYKSGSAHLRYGIQLLSELSVPGPTNEPTSTTRFNHSTPEDFVHHALIDSYARIAIQSAMFGIIPSHMCVMTRAPHINSSLRPFKSIIEARQTLDDILNRIKRLKENHHDAQEFGNPIDRAKELSTQSTIREDLFIWREVYNNYLRSLQPDIDRRDLVGSILIKIYHEMAMIMAGVSLSDNEMAFDTYTDRFTAIITGFMELWEVWSRQNPQDKDIEQLLNSPESGGHSFTIESGYIPPVYYTALKCRITLIRRQAIRALRSVPRREGVWNGPLLADVLEEVIRIEEGDVHGSDREFDAPTQHSGPPESQLSMHNVGESERLSDVKVLLADATDRDHAETMITYKKKTLDGNWAMVQRRVEPRASNILQLHASSNSYPKQPPFTQPMAFSI